MYSDEIPAARSNQQRAELPGHHSLDQRDNRMLSNHADIPTLADVGVYSPDKLLVVAIKMAGGNNADPMLLERMRAALARKSAPAKPLFLLVVANDGLYLWRAEAEPNSKPQYASIHAVMRDIAPRVLEMGGPFHANGLRILVVAWLNVLSLGLRQPNRESEADQLLIETGIYERILNGDVENDIPA